MLLSVSMGEGPHSFVFHSRSSVHSSRDENYTPSSLLLLAPYDMRLRATSAVLSDNYLHFMAIT